MSNPRKEKLRVGLVGAGYVSKHHLRALKKLDYVEVAAICDSNLDLAARAAKESGIPGVYQNLDEMAQEHLDVVHILTPPASHCALTVQALRGGCHVLVEKPMAPVRAHQPRAYPRARAGNTYNADGVDLSRDACSINEPYPKIYGKIPSFRVSHLA